MKILILDIETAPILAEVWGLWKNNVGLNQIRKNGYIMSWAAKWYGDDYVYYDDCRENGQADEKQLLKNLAKLVKKADAVVAHNGDNFDMKWIRAQMIYHGLKPLPPVKQIDTLKIAKGSFRFHSNRLEFLAKFLGCTPKDGHKKFIGHELWTECALGNQEAWDEMEKYNVQDVITLEEVFDKLRPWSKVKINVALGKGADTPTCPHCGGTHVHRRGYAYTGVSKFQRYKCNSCGTWSRGRVNLLAKERRSGVLVSIGS